LRTGIIERWRSVLTSDVGPGVIRKIDGSNAFFSSLLIVPTLHLGGEPIINFIS